MFFLPCTRLVEEVCNPMRVAHVRAKIFLQQQQQQRQTSEDPEGRSTDRSSHFTSPSAGLVSHSPAPSEGAAAAAEELESPKKEEGRVTLSSMKMSQCESIMDQPSASEEACGQERLNNKVAALQKEKKDLKTLSLISLKKGGVFLNLKVPYSTFCQIFVRTFHHGLQWSMINYPKAVNISRKQHI